ncbi:MAG: hypothetical protein Phog2KO_50910 [Phototrophicaceae bacterium]
MSVQCRFWPDVELNNSVRRLVGWEGVKNLKRASDKDSNIKKVGRKNAPNAKSM